MGKHGSSNSVPDLQALVARHGGYDRIPPEAWAEYELAMADWHERRRIRSPSSETPNSEAPADPETLCLCGLAGVYWQPRKGGGRPIWRCERHRDRWPDYAVETEDEAPIPTKETQHQSAGAAHG